MNIIDLYFCYNLQSTVYQPVICFLQIKQIKNIHEQTTIDAQVPPALSSFWNCNYKRGIELQHCIEKEFEHTCRFGKRPDIKLMIWSSWAVWEDDNKSSNDCGWLEFPAAPFGWPLLKVSNRPLNFVALTDHNTQSLFSVDILRLIEID